MDGDSTCSSEAENRQKETVSRKRKGTCLQNFRWESDQIAQNKIARSDVTYRRRVEGRYTKNKAKLERTFGSSHLMGMLPGVGSNNCRQ